VALAVVAYQTANGEVAEHKFAPARADIIARDAGAPKLGNPLPSPLFSAFYAYWEPDAAVTTPQAPLPMPCTQPLGENTAGVSAAKEPVDANVAGTTIIKAVKLAGLSRAADEEASNSAQGAGRALELAGPRRAADEEASNSARGTGRAQELRKQLAQCRADTAEALKELAASRERLEKLEAAKRRAKQHAVAAAQQRAATAAEQLVAAAA
jgi:hypothetical protein